MRRAMLAIPQRRVSSMAGKWNQMWGGARGGGLRWYTFQFPDKWKPGVILPRKFVFCRASRLRPSSEGLWMRKQACGLIAKKV